MADNIAVTPGSGATIAAEDVGSGVLVQRVKPTLGVTGTAVDVSSDNGVSGTGVQRVTIASDSTGQVAIASFKGLTLTDRSSTITTGGTQQTLMSTNSSRHGFMVENTSNGDLWINELGSSAVQASPSIKIASGNLYESPVGGASTAAISIIGATTGQSFTSREW
jgi:hypothetical protein